MTKTFAFLSLSLFAIISPSMGGKLRTGRTRTTPESSRPRCVKRNTSCDATKTECCGTLTCQDTKLFGPRCRPQSVRAPTCITRAKSCEDSEDGTMKCCDGLTCQGTKAGKKCRPANFNPVTIACIPRSRSCEEVTAGANSKQCCDGFTCQQTVNFGKKCRPKGLDPRPPVEPPLCLCAEEDSPVCGSDGKTYGNKCLLGCTGPAGTTKKCNGECPCDGVAPPPVEPPLCLCAEEDSPVCGSDGKTYGNKCLLGCTGPAGTTKKCNGECPCNGVAPPPVEPPLCLCAEEDSPVCGSDGKTYGNKCLLGCTGPAGITKKCNGACPCNGVAPPPVEPPLCLCAEEDSPVCGSDGKTYGNKCLLGCTGPAGTTKKCNGECPCNGVAPPPVEPPLCLCAEEDSPVCGSDGKTYGNKCLLGCTGPAGTTKKCNGECPCNGVAPPPVEPPLCLCAEEDSPVCGSDGKTYGNKCLLGCTGPAGTTKKCNGECPCNGVAPPPVEPPLCLCAEEDSPVCGSDGKTYGNKCLLGCTGPAGTTKKCNGECPCNGVAPPPVEPPLCLCAEEDSPVCGSDGKTYGNKCLLGCTGPAGTTKKCNGECPCNGVAPPPVEPPLCLCAEEDSPVCGSDGKTYGNKCLLGCTGPAGTTKKCNGECPCNYA